MFKDFVFRGKFGFTERQFCKSLGNSMVSMFLILIYDGIAPHKFSVLLILPLVGKIQYSVLTLEHTNGVTIFIPCTIHVNGGILLRNALIESIIIHCEQRQ